MQEPIELSAEETKEINKMMKENAKNAKKYKNAEKASDDKQVRKEVQEAFNGMKRLLKSRSKSELIEIIWNYGANLQEMQRVAQILLEENKELKVQLGLEESEEQDKE